MENDEYSIERLRNYLRNLITPQDDDEQVLFKGDPDIVDDYSHIINRLDSMSESELVDEINNQLAPYNLAIASTDSNDN